MTSCLRTCCVCGAKKQKKSLQRYVCGKGRPELDKRQILPGRGAYCCNNGHCAGLLLQMKKKWKRLFRL